MHKPTEQHLERVENNPTSKIQAPIKNQINNLAPKLEPNRKTSFQVNTSETRASNWHEKVSSLGI